MGPVMAGINYYANLIFTIVFGAEMVLKVVGLGIFGYLRDILNVIDGVIVIHSLLELYLDTGINSLQAIKSLKGLRALKSMRALRAVRGLRYLSALPKIIAILLGCMRSFVAVLLLLFLFQFQFALVGLHLFGSS